MSASPSHNMFESATTSDFAVLEAMDRLEARAASVENIVGGLGKKLNRMFLAMIAFLIATAAAVTGVLLSL